MTVSVIIPAFSAAKTIGNAIKSVLKQDASCDVEIIVVDDASPDDIESAVCGFPVALMRNPVNLGRSGAREVGRKAASGDAILFLDADDRLGKGQLGTMLAFMQSQGADMVHCATEVSGNDGRRLVINPENAEIFFLKGWTLPIHSMLIRRSACPAFDLDSVCGIRGVIADLVIDGARMAHASGVSCLYNYSDMKPEYRLLGADAGKIRRRINSWLMRVEDCPEKSVRLCANLLGCLNEGFSRDAASNGLKADNLSDAMRMMAEAEGMDKAGERERRIISEAFGLCRANGFMPKTLLDIFGRFMC